jgi:putative Holliday junction resolvase
MPRIIGVDYGKRRIGIAVSDSDADIAFPLETIEISGVKAAARRIAVLCEEQGVSEIVVGLPLNMNGSEGQMAAEARTFGERLNQRGNCPVHMWDERLTTAGIEKTLIEADVSRRKRRQVRDKLAAQQILQGYLDARKLSSRTPPEER